jgi:Trk K+ transport system NAD-binding subunit
LNIVILLFFRRMRAPLLVLITAYAVSIGGLVIIPGTDSEGVPWRLDFFDAFYFVSYMGTTIGFGELPREFSAGQRMWTMVAIYLTVIAWLYAIGGILTLIQDSTFKLAITEQRFAGRVRRLRRGFYLICGYGETGSLLVWALCRRGIQSVVIDKDPTRINALLLQGLSLDVPCLCADAQIVRHLVEAGLKHPQCMGIVALTDDDDVNLKIAITSKLLNPSLKTVCRAESRDTAANMASCNTDHVISPFETFANRLAIALHTPSAHLLYDWLVQMSNRPLHAPLEPPRGTWILSGFGRFGKAVNRYLEYEGIPSVIIERHPENAPEGAIIGLGTEAVTLREAGVKKAVGIVAGTHWDTHNLSVIMTARALNPDLYLVARQNQHSNTELFEAADLHWIMQGNMMIVRHILPLLTEPMLYRFLHQVRHHQESWAKALVDRVRAICGGVTPEVWSVRIDPEQAPAVHDAVSSGRELRIGHLLRDPQDRECVLPCLVLMVYREGKELLLPGDDERIATDDCMLLCAHYRVPRRMGWTLKNINVLSYLETGEVSPDGYVWRWLHERWG